MRNGQGDEWWIVFHRDGWAALKGLDHESPAWTLHGEALSLALQHSVPKELKAFTTEPAFRWDQTSFAYFISSNDKKWTRVNDLTKYSFAATGDDQLLAHLVGDASDYANFATDYYEVDVDKRIVDEVFTLQPITSLIVHSLNPSTSLSEISEELYGQIGYPTAT